MGRRLQAADTTLVHAAAETVRELPAEALDAAAVRLAQLYAEAIDVGACPECAGRSSVLAELGPKLLAALVELGATPRSRSAVKGGGEVGSSPLERLRAARRA